MRRILSLVFISLLIAYSLQLTAAHAASESFFDAEKSFLEGNYEMTVSQAQRLIDGRSRRIDEIRYLKGLSELKLGRFNDARESFNYIISKYPNSKKVFDAQLGIGDSYMLAGDLDSAAGIYQGMLDKFRSNDNIQIIRSRLASCRNSPGLTAKTAVVQPRPAATVKAKAVPKVPEELDLIMATGELFSVQVGSFKNRSNADRLAQKLAAAGYESRVEIPVSPLDKLYRVKVGRISSRGEAEALSARLKAAGYSTKICDGETL